VARVGKQSQTVRKPGGNGFANYERYGQNERCTHLAGFTAGMQMVDVPAVMIVTTHVAGKFVGHVGNNSMLRRLSAAIKISCAEAKRPRLFGRKRGRVRLQPAS
jgi:hypothetical protein